MPFFSSAVFTLIAKSELGPFLLGFVTYYLGFPLNPRKVE